MFLPYLMFGYAAAALLLLAGLHAGSRAVPGLRGTRQLRAALYCALAGVLLGAMRTVAPEWITILCANAAILSCFLLIYWATAAALSAPASFLRPLIVLDAASIAGIAFYTFVQPNLVARILISSGCMAVYAASTAALLFGFREQDADWAPDAADLRSQARAVGWLQVVIGANHGTRCVLTLLYPPRQFVHLDTIQTGFTYMNMLLNVGAVCGVIWLALCVHRRGLQKAARTDGLTGLLNRRAFEEVLARDLRRASHARQPISILLLDIDHFKTVHDSWGHQAGDEVIRRVGSALHCSMRPTDILCRFGGEEFVMLLNSTPLQAEEIAWRLRAEIESLSDLPSGLRLTASLGVAVSRAEDSPDQLLHRCDQALYRSKRSGRNRVTVDRTPSHSFPISANETLSSQAASDILSGTHNRKPNW